MFRLHRWRRHDLDSRVKEAREQAEQSRRELEETRQITEPVRRAGEENHFSELIRASLLGGRKH